MPKTVMVCDDDLCMIVIVEHVAREEGFEVISAENGRDGLDMARKHLPDLLILDVMLPDIDGLEVCTQLKSDPATRQIPVFLLTAMGQVIDVEKGYRAGADDYLQKPFSARGLRMRLHQVLDARE